MKLRSTKIFTFYVLKLSVSLLLLGTTIACDEVSQLDNIEIPIVTTTTIEKGTALEMVLNGFPQLDGFTGINLAQQSKFEDSGYSQEDVDRITLTSIVMRVTEPEGPPADLAFLGAMRFFVETRDLPRFEIASAAAPNEGDRRISFDTSRSDLKDYLLGGGVITVEVDDARRPDVDTTIEIAVVFDVDINLI